MKIVTIVGARPQFIKAATVSRAMSEFGDSINELIVHTGQHYDANMSDVFFSEMNIPRPAYSLGVGGNSHGAMTGQMLEKIEQVLLDETPDYTLIYGDTNSTLAGALAASKLHIPIAHVEAGLRSLNWSMPEEKNRVLADRLSQLLFCPTEQSVQNLTSEGADSWGSQVHLSGDVMHDGALYYAKLAQRPRGLEVSDGFALCTVHRAENTDSPDRLTGIFAALTEIATRRPVVLPLHPRTRARLVEFGIPMERIISIEPVGYLNMVWLIQNSSLVLTDSGGLQKESFFFGRPCITLRDETEWNELVENRFNRLAGADQQRIVESASALEWCNDDFDMDLYGGGKASLRIATTLAEA